VPWSVEASNVITQAVAASRRERETRPVHLLVALSEGFGPIAAGLSRNGPLHAPDGGGDDELPRRVLTKKQLRGPLGDAIRRHAAASLRLPQVSAAAEGLAGSQGQSVLPAHLLVALLDQDDAEVRQATDANGLDHAALRRDALRELSAPDHLPTLRMPDLHWAPLAEHDIADQRNPRAHKTIPRRKGAQSGSSAADGGAEAVEVAAPEDQC
jgi:ATP-dependent Clp protease ATP-binding subunit ClpA